MSELDEYVEAYQLGLLSYDDLMVAFEAYLSDRHEMNAARQVGLFSDDEVRTNFRFEIEDLQRLLNLLEIPEIVNASGYQVPGMTALCILLRRLAYPNRLVDLGPMFHMSITALSVIAKHMTSYINARKVHLIEDLATNHWLDAEKLSSYAEDEARKGAALTNWGFIDGTASKMCRPTHDQQLQYAGHKRFHCLKYQSILTPEGLIINLQGPFEGRRHDAGIWTGCGIQRQVRQLCVTPERTFVLYGDPAYPVSDILLAPYPSMNQQLHAQAFNRSMSKVRQAVEWGFGKVIQQFAFVDFSKNQKFELQDVGGGGMYNAAVLLTNCHTCLYGSQGSQYFSIEPPSLEVYLTSPVGG